MRRRSMRGPTSFARLAAACAICMVAMQSASALSPSGEVMAVIQATSASGPGGARTLSTTGPVYSGDRIKTGKAGEAQIRFIDDTRLVVGASSSIVIDKYVFNPDKTVAQVGLQFTKGTLRFITGSGPKRGPILLSRRRRRWVSAEQGSTSRSADRSAPALSSSTARSRCAVVVPGAAQSSEADAEQWLRPTARLVRPVLRRTRRP